LQQQQQQQQQLKYNGLLGPGPGPWSEPEKHNMLRREMA